MDLVPFLNQPLLIHLSHHAVGTLVLFYPRDRTGSLSSYLDLSLASSELPRKIFVLNGSIFNEFTA